MNVDRIEESKTLIKQLINEERPDVDTRRGTFAYEILVSLGAIGLAHIQETAENFNIVNTIQKAIDNPDIADTAVVDGLVSNWFQTRKAGQAYSGPIRVNVNTARDFFIPSGTAFTASDGNVYNTTEDAQISSSDLVTAVDGSFFFSLNVTASASGESFFIQEGALLSTAVFPTVITSVVTLSDFANGKDDETNADLLKRTQEQTGTRDFVSRRSIVPKIEEDVENVSETFVVGHDDNEMQRNVNVVGIKSDGAVDVYIRESNITRAEVTLSTNADGVAYLSGYPILRINSYYAGNNEANRITDIDFEVESTSAFIAPKFARYSKNERLKLNTIYPNAQVTVNFDYFPSVTDGDVLSKDSTIKTLGTNVLVKSFMPSYLSFGIIYETSDNSDEDVTSITNSLVSFINSWKNGRFPVSKVCQFIHNNGSENLTSVELEDGFILGTYYLPTGEIEEVRSGTIIEIPSNFEDGYSNNNFRFFANSSDISFERRDV